ncbi:hypothetical protein DFH11DRAFT_1328993 [Phellopilus nigrolimitatus]|nr:hypothetical protein DFH11DRAFT_1328993 [Phellopilus nigrolimitatus]
MHMYSINGNECRYKKKKNTTRAVLKQEKKQTSRTQHPRLRTRTYTQRKTTHHRPAAHWPAHQCCTAAHGSCSRSGSRPHAASCHWTRTALSPCIAAPARVCSATPRTQRADAGRSACDPRRRWVGESSRMAPRTRPRARRGCARAARRRGRAEQAPSLGSTRASARSRSVDFLKPSGLRVLSSSVGLEI